MKKTINLRIYFFFITTIFVVLCLPALGFNRIPLHDMLHALMHYNYIAREWVNYDQLLTFWNPFREFGMDTFIEHIFLFHPFQYITIFLAKLFGDQNTIFSTNLTYIFINLYFSLSMGLLILRLTNSFSSSLFGVFGAAFFFPWFASPTFNLTSVWILPTCYIFIDLLFKEKRLIFLVISVIFFIYGAFQGNGYIFLITSFIFFQHYFFTF